MGQTLKDVFEKYRLNYNDIQLAEYVQPRGTALHVIRLIPSGDEIIVSGSQGAITFAPGDRVLLGTPFGRRSRVILGAPPAGDQGGFLFSDVELPTTSIDRILLTTVTPGSLNPNTLNNQVFLIGYGFSPDPVDAVTAEGRDPVTFNWVPDPWCSIHDVTFEADPTSWGIEVLEDQTMLRIEVDVISAAPIDHLIPLRIRRAGAAEAEE